MLRISPAQHSTTSDDRRRRRQGRRSIFPNRLSTTRLRLPRQPAAANGTTTPGFSGPFPSQCVDAAHADTRVPFCSWQLGSFLFGMPARGPSRPLLVGFRVAALDSVRHCKVAGGHSPTVPGGRQAAGLPHRGCPLHGIWALRRSGVDEAVGPALAVRKLSLWVASPGSESSPLPDRSLGRRPSVTLFQRGTACFRLKARRSNSEIDLCSNRFELCVVRNTSAHRKRLTTGEECLHRLPEMVHVPPHCLVTVSVAMHTGQLGLRIQGLPLPGHHLKLTRHVSYVCGGVVDGIQLNFLSVKRTIWRRSENSSQLRLLGISLKKPLVENRRHAGEIVSSVGETRHLRASSVWVSLTRLVCDIKVNPGEIRHLHT